MKNNTVDASESGISYATLQMVQKVSSDFDDWFPEELKMTIFTIKLKYLKSILHVSY